MSNHVVYSCDDQGVRFLAVSLLSLLKRYRGKAPLVVDILEGFGGLSAESHATLSSVVARFPFATLRYVDVMPVVAPVRDLLQPREGSRWNVFAWMPIFAPEVLADVEGNLLYLDIDTLVNTDVAPLFDLTLGDDLFAAVYESHYRVRKNKQSYEWREGLLPEAAHCYFNDGVLVFNTARYRQEKCLDALLAWYRVHAEKAFRIEQDALNAVFWNRMRALPIKWNYHDRLVRKHCLRRRRKLWCGNPPDECLAAALDPAILHFWGRKKPWNPSHRPYRHLYHDAMRELGQEIPPEQPSAWLNNLINAIAFALIKLRVRR